MASPVEELQRAGFSEDEIAAWATERRTTLTTAGFPENEIDAYFTGGVVAPTTVPDPFVKRLEMGQRISKIWGAVTKEAAHGYGDAPPTGLDDKTLDEFIKLGIFHDPAKGKPGPIQFASEAMILPAAQTIGAVFRGISAGVHGAGALIGAMHQGILEDQGTTGVDPETEGNRAKREIINFGNWAMIEAGFGRFSRPQVGPQGGVVDQPIGGLPKSADFVNGAKTLTEGDAPMGVQQKLLRTWEERGVHPSEMAADAAADPVLKQRMLSKDPQDLPYSSETVVDINGKRTTIRDGKVVDGEGGKPPAEPPKPPEPPEPGSFEAAQKAVLDKISVGGKDTQRPWNLDRLYTETIDDLHPIKGVSEDAYQLARLTRGQFGKASYFLERGTFDFGTLKDTGKPLREILEPVSKDLNGLRAYLTSRRAVEIEASGRKSGIDLAAAEQVVAEGGARYGKIADELVGYQQAVLKYLKDSGVLSEEAFAAMTEANKHYVPFYRVLDEGVGGPKGGGSLGPGSPIKRLKGSERDIVDPLESIIKNTYAYISVAERSDAGMALIDALKAQGEKVTTHRPKAAAETVQYLRENGVRNADPAALADMIENAGASDGTVIRGWRDGVRHEVKVNDPELVIAFQNIDRSTAGLLTKILSVPSRSLRAGTVVLPDFIARNLIRDFITAFINSKGVFTPIDSLKGLYSVLRKDQHWENWVKGGGSNSAMAALDRAYLQESLTSLAGETGLMSRAWNVIKNPVDTTLRPLQMVSELIEGATRVGEFRKNAGLNASKSQIQEAAFASREVTLDFARMGAKMRAWSMVTAFFNPSLQGMDRVVRGFIDRPANTLLKIAGGVTLPSVLLWWANKDDKRVQDLPQWQKDMTWIIPTDDWQPISGADAAGKPAHLVRERGGKWEFNNGVIYRIPKPFEVGVIFGSGVERFLDWQFANNPHAFEQFGKSMVEALTPSVLPTFAIPLGEQFANRSTFSDRTLIPADMEKHLPEYQYTPYTTQLSRKLGQVVAAFPGIREASVDPGNPAGPAARAVSSPILIENYVRAWTGGLGMYALQAADAALRKAGVLPDPVAPTPTLADIPFVKAFIVRYPSAGLQPIQDFYDDHEKQQRFFKTWMARAQEGDTEAMARIQDAGGPMVFMQLDAFKETLSEHSKMIRDIYKNPGMPADEKRQLIDGLYYAMIEMGRAGRDIQRSVKDKAGEPQP